MRNAALEKEILNCTDDKFNDLAVKIFHYQVRNCPVYAKWLQNCERDPAEIREYEQIPFLPISFFKTEKMGFLQEHTGRYLQFASSSTTGTGVSTHWVAFPEWYEAIFREIFFRFYGDPANTSILALLPSYLDRPNSSLVYMAENLIRSAQPNSTFINSDTQKLLDILTTNEANGTKTLLLGVTYALLDLAAAYQGQPLQHCTIMETGGMKGKRKEMVREEVHSALCKAFGVNSIHSEYGMTELLSQAYSTGNGIFQTPPWMRVQAMQVSDPFSAEKQGKTGRVCVTDLANLYSCAFIATDDLGKVYHDHGFEIMGRMDFSDTRGCNLMWD
jgi:phenylacetate-coenzyme A ligase PaaK-like adenylate-forming protein